MRAARDDDVHLETHQLGGKFGKALCAPSGKPILNVNVLSFNIAQLTQTFAKCRNKRAGITGRPAAHVANDRWHGLLGGRPKLPHCRRAAEKGNKIASSHWIAFIES